MTEDTVALLRQLNIDRAFVFGFSDGGIVGLDMAIHHPDLVDEARSDGRQFPYRRLRRQDPRVAAHRRA